ncbi:hypothetical protein [Streptomyces malaysiensis]|nr:hypothetical protein [Streptomyces malaysiensis]
MLRALAGARGVTGYASARRSAVRDSGEAAGAVREAAGAVRRAAV